LRSVSSNRTCGTGWIIKFKVAVVIQQYIGGGRGRYLVKKFINFVSDLMTQHECVPWEAQKPGKHVHYSYTWNCTGTGSLQTWKRYYVNHVLFQTPHQ
jgi:hypothetical protein